MVRYRQLHALHEQLRRDMQQQGSFSAAYSLPQFPPKKFMPLSQMQVRGNNC